MRSQNRNSKLSDLRIEDSNFSPHLSVKSSNQETSLKTNLKKPSLKIFGNTNAPKTKNVATQQDEFSISLYTSPRYSNFHSIRETNENLHTPNASSNSTSDVNKIDTARSSSIYGHISQCGKGKDIKFQYAKGIM